MDGTGKLEDPNDSPDAGLALVLPGRRRPAAAGWEWVARGWALFRMAPVMWIVAMVALFLISLASSLVPVLGNLAYAALSPVFSAGWVAACRALEREGEFDIEHLLGGFSRRFGKLAVLGLIYLGAMLLLLVVFALIVGLPLMGVLMTGDPQQVAAGMRASLPWLLLGVLVGALLAVPILAAFWFAPALVYMHDVNPVAAMKASFGACFRNLGSLFVYGLVLFAILVIALIPLFLGLLVFFPLLVTSGYAAYRDIFTDDAAAAPAAATPADRAASAAATGGSWS
jgi:hypothetical protein